MTDKVVLVTGGAKRIGRSIALQLAARGAQVVIHYNNSEQAARATAEAANRTKDEFLATVSHELRTPLTVILGWSAMLRHGGLDEATSARALEIIDRNVKAQAQLIQDILDASAIAAGKLRLEVKPVRRNVIGLCE